jgi:class 3 adenylate cyclase
MVMPPADPPAGPASEERARLLSSPLVAQAFALGLSEADVVGLAQAYARAVARIVAAETHVIARQLAKVPAEQRAEWARRRLDELMPLTGPAFEALHAEQLESAVQALPASVDDRAQIELAVSFVDLCGSTDFMLAGSRDEIRALVDGVFFASREIARRYDVVVSKHLGDGVLLVGPSRAETIEAVGQLVAELGRRTPLQAAAGIDFGKVTTRAGDYFGPPVNLAARLAEAARAGEVLVGAAAVPDPPPNGTWESQTVRGVAKPQRVLRLS